MRIIDENEMYQWVDFETPGIKPVKHYKPFNHKIHMKTKPKKYRLMKDTPAAKKDNTYIMTEGVYAKNSKIEEDYYKPNYVENNPEWFEEIIEKEYQILRFNLVEDSTGINSKIKTVKDER